MDFTSIINADEGVVKMKFRSAEEARAEQAKLLQSNDVESIEPNFFYRIAMHIEHPNPRQQIRDGGRIEILAARQTAARRPQASPIAMERRNPLIAGRQHPVGRDETFRPVHAASMSNRL